MNSDWLTASSFERSSEVMSAINVLSIHAKLTLAGVDDPTDLAEISKAKAKLVRFLEELRKLVDGAGQTQANLMVGTDPRLGELALEYIGERRRLPPRAQLYTLSVAQLSALVESDSAEDVPKLVECLESLRSLFERHAHNDIAGIFGDE